ncbi:MAG: hypothetical protein QM699_07540 [Amaricoccus sp.]|uniref:hypothetical protein n=1 Tax=Amaricoccus sp. TaxID=1872485 RepID=UPI0039E25677
MTAIAEIAAIYQAETPLGVCIREVENGPDIWLPISAVEVEPENEALALERGVVVKVTAPEGLLLKMGLI